MKLLLSLIILFLTTIVSQAQYVTYSEYFNIDTRKLPRYCVPANNRTFALSCTAERQVQNYVQFQQIDQQLQFLGLRRINQPNSAYLQIILDLKSLLIDGYDVQEHITESRNRQGQPIKIHTFVGVLHYTMPNSWIIKTPTEYFNSDAALQYAHKTFVTDREYDNPRAAIDFVRNNRDVFLEQIINHEVMENIDRIVDLINANYIYSPTTERIDLYYFCQKKNPYYNLHRTLPQKTKAYLSHITADGRLATTEIEMAEIIEHFKKVESSLSFADKKQRKGKYAMLYNLAQLNYVFENFSQAKQYAQQIINSGYYKVVGRSMLDKINLREAQLIKHNLTTQHFVVE